MPPPLGPDLTGQSFGYLRVLQRAAPVIRRRLRRVDKHGDQLLLRTSRWLCRCEYRVQPDGPICGNETTVEQGALVSGGTQTCGAHGWWRWWAKQAQDPAMIRQAEAVQALARQGLSTGAIARQLGISFARVRRIVERQGLRPGR